MADLIQLGIRNTDTRHGYSVAMSQLLGRLDGMISVARSVELVQELEDLKEWAEGKSETVKAAEAASK
jgi:hypothetical protein